MADNVTVDNGDLADFTFASDKIAGVDWQYVKLAYGIDGVATVVDGTADLDTGGGTDTRPAVGILLGASGGAAVLPGDATYGAKVQIALMPASASTTDSISAKLATDKIMSNLTEVVPKFFSASVNASSTDSELIAAVTSKKLRIIALAVQCAGTATTITFESGTSTRIHKVPAGANGGQVLGPNVHGWFETTSGAALTCTTGSGSTTEITGTYIEV